MADAKRDENNIATLIAALNTNGLTPILVKANPSNDNALVISNGTTGTDFGRNVAYRDSNDVPVLMAISEADGVTPVEVYADVDGSLLIDHS